MRLVGREGEAVGVGSGGVGGYGTDDGKETSYWVVWWWWWRRAGWGGRGGGIQERIDTRENTRGE